MNKDQCYCPIDGKQVNIPYRCGRHTCKTCPGYKAIQKKPLLPPYITFAEEYLTNPYQSHIPGYPPQKLFWDEETDYDGFRLRILEELELNSETKDKIQIALFNFLCWINREKNKGLLRHSQRIYTQREEIIKHLAEVVKNLEALNEPSLQMYSHILPPLSKKIGDWGYNMEHTDLVYPARILWKGKLDSLRFSSIEKEIFQCTRTQDIAGSMIPDVYFAYQRHGRTENLKEVFQHNLMDVVNLVMLYQEVANRFCYPSRYACTSVAVARYLFYRDRDKAVSILESGLNRPDCLNNVYLAKKLLAHHYKAQGRYNQAVQHWKDMISLDPKAELTPFIELAKYYEHVAKDLHKARHMMHLIDSLSFSYDKALENRKQRIEEKYKKCQRLALSSPRALSF